MNACGAELLLRDWIGLDAATIGQASVSRAVRPISARISQRQDAQLVPLV